VLLTGVYFWNQTAPGYADVMVTWSFDPGSFPVASLELWANINTNGYQLLATVPSNTTNIVYPKATAVPAGSRMVEARVIADAGGASVTNATALVISAPMAVTEHEETRAKTELGAAQKDTARELSAKLASLKGIVWVGVVMFLFGLASMFYPPLQAIIGSVTTSIAITAGGVALMVLPSLVVGNELLILGGVAAAVGLWFFAHRHGQLRGLVDAAKADLKALIGNSDKGGAA